jgi:hypothetical protein
VGDVSELREIKWKVISGVESYDVSIYTEAGDLMWKETVRGSIAILPDSVRKMLIPGGSYSWQVEARTDKGEYMKSQVVQFRIKY